MHLYWLSTFLSLSNEKCENLSRKWEVRKVVLVFQT